MFLDTVVYKGTRFKEKSILDVKTHFKKTETFQYTHFTSFHPPKEKPWESYEPTPQKLRWRKIFQISKNAWLTLPTNYDRKPSIRYKVHGEGVCSPETKQQRGKRNIALRHTVPALRVYFISSFNEKIESYTKPTFTSPNFWRSTYHFLQERKIPQGHAR